MTTPIATVVDRSLLEKALAHPFSPLPPGLRSDFLRFQYQHERGFLLLVNLLAQAAYFSYWVADLLLMPDIAGQSLQVRGLFLLLTLPLVLGLFRYCKQAAVLDLVLPVLILLAGFCWFRLLEKSQSPHVSTYLYSSLIFIVLANLSVRVNFTAALGVSLIITATTLQSVYALTTRAADEFLVFLLVYLPVLFFSVFGSFTATLAARRAYLRAALEARARDELDEANARLLAQAETDALTGIGNRRRFERLAERFWRDHEQTGRTFGLLLADIDHFKRYNDRYGHPAGDACLIAVADVLAGLVRAGDYIAGRYGGEEFAVLIAPASPEVLAQVAERLVRAVHALGIPHENRPDGHALVTLSVGGALSTHPTVGSLHALKQRADALLYAAKDGGRNGFRTG